MNTLLYAPNVSSNKNRIYAIDSVTAISALSGLPQDQVAIQSALVLAALAGPRAGLVSLGGEVQTIGSSMISLGGDSPEQARLSDLLFSPLRYLQEDLIDYSRRVDTELRERLATSLADPHHKDSGYHRSMVEEGRADAELKHATGQAGKSTQVVSESYPVDRYAAFQREQSMTQEERAKSTRIAEECAFAKVDFETMLAYNEARCLREPLVFLENPDSQLLLRGMDRVDRQSPLVLDSDGRLLAGVFGKPRNKAAEVVEGLLSGRSSSVVKGIGASPGRGILFSVIDRYRLGQWMSREGGNSLSRALLLDPINREGEKPESFDAEKIQCGYELYRKAVKGVLRLRRLDAPGVAPILGGETAERFFHAQREFQEQINEVAPRLKPYAAHFVHLPATMLWALDHLCPGQRYMDLIPTAMHLAEAAIRTHLSLVQQLLDSGQRQGLEENGLKMLRKLCQYEPCRFRDLYRKFDDQRKFLHEPVLDYLIETERVKKVKKGMLQITARGRVELEGVGQTSEIGSPVQRQ